LTRLRPLGVLAGLVASVACLYLAVRDVDFELFYDALGEMRYWWILPALFVLAISVALRAIRWRYLFSPATRPPPGATLRALLVGELFNVALPLRTGEFVRVVVVHREAGTSRSEALATALVERFLDILVLLVLLFAVLPFAPEISWLGVAASVLAVGVVVLSAGIFVLHRYGERPISFLLRPLARLPGLSTERTTAAAVSSLRGFEGLRNARTGLVAAALTAGGWLAVAFAFWLLMRGLQLDLGYEAAVLVVVAITFALILPALPAGIGVFEAAVLVALRPFDVGDSEALSCAVVLHVVSLAGVLTAGVVALRSHRSLRPVQSV
jgi:glycosyltransferase 2 family protein